MPSFSMGKQQKKASFVSENHVPGAGTYSSNIQNSSKVIRGPTFVIAKSTRLKTDKPLGPGPTSYDLTKKSFFANKTRGYHITGKVRERIRSQGPGPGSYSIPKLGSSKYYSFGSKTQIINLSKNFPGPGCYDPQKIRYSQAISFQFSKRPSPEGSPKNVPGPGNYETEGIKQVKNKFGFTKRQKFFQQIKYQKQKKIIPGPGAYSNININNIKKQIFAVKFGKNKREFFGGESRVPGPGAYSPTNSSNKRSPVATIGNSPKSISKNDKNPGPASYKISQLSSYKKNQPHTIFGKTERSFINQKLAIQVGPGSYNIDYQDRGHSYSITGRNSNEKQNNTPGPQSYSPKFDSQYRKTEMAIIGKDRKFAEYKEFIPGPGTYNLNQNKIKAKTFYFPKQQRKQQLNSNPGPGTYKLKSFIGQQAIKNQKN